jgi:hypothetical protein
VDPEEIPNLRIRNTGTNMEYLFAEMLNITGIDSNMHVLSDPFRLIKMIV